MDKTITIGISSCPNDTFMFDAIYNKRIDLKGIDFEFVIEDIEQLNEKVLNQSLDVSKLSYHAYATAMDNYQLLDGGSALGRNCGPLLIAKAPLKIEELSGQETVAIPGIHTTANLLTTIAFPKLVHKTPVLFSEIEKAITEGKFDLGLIIHESRFTYASKGLFKVVDLGEYWEENTGKPIPLGGIAIKRNLSHDIKKVVNNIVKESVTYAFMHPEKSKAFTKSFAQEMDDDVIEKHIKLYVNEYSKDLGATGREAIIYLYNRMNQLNLLNKKPKNIFIP